MHITSHQANKCIQHYRDKRYRASGNMTIDDRRMYDKPMLASIAYLAVKVGQRSNISRNDMG